MNVNVIQKVEEGVERTAIPPLAAPTGSDARPTENQVRECLGCEKTSLESLKAAGYTLDNNGYGYFFRWKGGVYLQSIPAWVRELLNDTRRSADENARREMREALGITDKHQNAESCESAGKKSTN